MKYFTKTRNWALISSIFIMCLFALLNTFCAKKEKNVLVRVDGSTLTLEEFQKYIPESEYKNLSEGTITEILNNWANQEILYLEAKKRGIDKEDSVRMLIEQYTKNLMAMALIRRAFGSTTVNDAEIQEYFNKHQDEFLYAVKVAQIVLPSYEAAMVTYNEIMAGADFMQLAKERSLTRMEDPENPKIVTEYLPRGHIGNFATEEAIFNLKLNEVSQPIPYIQGTYLIVKLLDKKKVLSRAVLTDELKGQIYNYLISRKYQEFFEKFLDSLKTIYKVTTDLTPLKK
jgi:peptidyl-prolyl cis-trans isomerase C|uniref:peptidylprolyl isomerase n=1 Tax=candidate division WOR-3 bacterium TaxID=2052148 RepID=A0A7V3RHJ6_UNCW3